MSLNLDPKSPVTEDLKKLPKLPAPDFDSRDPKKVKLEEEAVTTTALKRLTDGPLIAIPPTPYKIGQRGPQPNFPNRQPEVTNHFFSSQLLGLDLNRSYTKNERIYTLMAQRSSKDCGAYALLMLFTDLMRKQIPISFGNDLMHWVSRAYLLNADNLIAQAKKHKVTMVKEKLPIALAIDTIQKRISESSYPVIVSISEPIGGHWIIVDHIEEKKVYIRDPFTGHAYAIPEETFLSYLDRSGIEQCLSVNPS